MPSDRHTPISNKACLRILINLCDPEAYADDARRRHWLATLSVSCSPGFCCLFIALATHAGARGKRATSSMRFSDQRSAAASRIGSAPLLSWQHASNATDVAQPVEAGLCTCVGPVPLPGRMILRVPRRGRWSCRGEDERAAVRSASRPQARFPGLSIGNQQVRRGNSAQRRASLGRYSDRPFRVDRGAPSPWTFCYRAMQEMANFGDTAASRFASSSMTGSNCSAGSAYSQFTSAEPFYCRECWGWVPRKPGYCRGTQMRHA